MIYIRQIEAKDTWNLRQTVMWPEKSLDFVKLKDDELGFHFGLFQNEILCAVISLFCTGKSAQFRKFATLQHLQKQGLGTQLLEYVIEFSRSKNIDILWCDARVSATAFYQKFGFEIISQPFTKETELYVKMEKIFNIKQS